MQLNANDMAEALRQLEEARYSPGNSSEPPPPGSETWGGIPPEQPDDTPPLSLVRALNLTGDSRLSLAAAAICVVAPVIHEVGVIALRMWRNHRAAKKISL